MKLAASRRRRGLMVASSLILCLRLQAAAHDHAHYAHAHDDVLDDEYHHLRPHHSPGSWHTSLVADDGPEGGPESQFLSEEEMVHHESLHGRIEPDHLHHDHDHHHADVFESCLLLCYEDMAEKYGVEFANQMKEDGFQFEQECPDRSRERRLGATNDSRLQWNIPSLRLPDGRLQIPFVVMPSPYFNQDSYDTIQRALDTTEAKSGVVTFTPRTSQTNYIRIQYSSTIGCAANVGRFAPTNIYLGWCKQSVHLSSIIHEILHALGFWHEQSRPDRDNYVSIVWANIQAGTTNNFAKMTAVE